MKMTSVLSALALTLSVAAAPLAAEEAKPTVSSQTLLGTMTPAAAAAIGIVGLGLLIAISDDSDSTPVTTE